LLRGPAARRCIEQADDGCPTAHSCCVVGGEIMPPIADADATNARMMSA
jgi:hypothetical protein